jgi:hypothetical protein
MRTSAQWPSPDDRNSRYRVWAFQRDIHPSGGRGAKTGFVARAPAFRARFSSENFLKFLVRDAQLEEQIAEGQPVEFVASVFRSIWGAEPGRLPYLNRPSFFGEILCCWRPRWIVGSEGSPMHAYTWYVWRKTSRSGPSLKVRVGRNELTAFLAQ